MKPWSIMGCRYLVNGNPKCRFRSDQSEIINWYNSGIEYVTLYFIRGGYQYEKNI